MTSRDYFTHLGIAMDALDNQVGVTAAPATDATATNDAASSSGGLRSIAAALASRTP